VLVGVTALIPIFGAFIGTGIGAFLILFESPIKAIGFVVFIIVLQQLEGNIIYPKVVGSQVGLPGLWVLIAVTIGSEFGIVGMLVSVPVASLIYTVLHQFVDARLEEKGLLDSFAEEEPTKKAKMKPPKKSKKRKKSKEQPSEAVIPEDARAESDDTDSREEQKDQ
jgi:predicted PurR-regulated permease PerM